MFPKTGSDFDIGAYMGEVIKRNETFEASGSGFLPGGSAFFYDLFVRPDVDSKGKGNWKIVCNRSVYPPISAWKSPSDIESGGFEKQLAPFGNDEGRDYAKLAFETAEGLLKSGQSLDHVELALK